MTTLDNIQASLAPEIERLNTLIRSSLATDNEVVDFIIHNYLRTKGKQIRPLLVLLSARMLGEINDNVFYAAASLEMLHNATLIHDDVVDNSDRRRGNPTINAVWNNHIAVLVGDFFVSRSLAVGLKTGNVNVVAALSALGEELSVGEIDQIFNARGINLDEQKYLSVIGKKTASLFTHCVRLGAETAGATPAQIAPMAEYARLLGLCFQIKDDIFDYYPDEKVGKPTGNDLREGKITMPLLYALNNSQSPRAAEMRQLVHKEQLSDEEITLLIEFAKQEGGIEYAYQVMRDMQQQADQIILQYPAGTAREQFRAIFDYILTRDK